METVGLYPIPLCMYAIKCLFHSPNMPPNWSFCKPMMIAWAVGGEGDMLPENVGLPLGNEDGRPTFFMLETHYDNPQIFSGESRASDWNHHNSSWDRSCKV